jgi:hypothetical protein
MGYNTDYKGVMKFTTELRATELAYLRSLFDEDIREHPEWPKELLPTMECWIKLELTPDFSGLQWSGAEKTYGMEELLNFIIGMMQKRIPNFGLEGQMVAQGEDIDDRYTIGIQDGRAVRQEIVIEGTKITCPHCEGEFYLSASRP